jgi:hypothetical protein
VSIRAGQWRIVTLGAAVSAYAILLPERYRIEASPALTADRRDKDNLLFITLFPSLKPHTDTVPGVAFYSKPSNEGWQLFFRFITPKDRMALWCP